MKLHLVRCRAEDVPRYVATGWSFSRWVVGPCGETMALMERES